MLLEGCTHTFQFLALWTMAWAKIVYQKVVVLFIDIFIFHFFSFFFYFQIYPTQSVMNGFQTNENPNIFVALKSNKQFYEYIYQEICKYLNIFKYLSYTGPLKPKVASKIPEWETICRRKVNEGFNLVYVATIFLGGNIN